MPDTGRLFDSLRPGRFDGERLAIALAISLAAHLIGFGGYELGKQTNLAKWLHLLAAAKQSPAPVQRIEEPVQFVMVNQPSTEAPKNAKYVSSKNSVAANPDADKQTENPKLNGKQMEIAMAETAPRQNLSKPQSQSPAQQQPKSANTPGDLTLGKPDNSKLQEQPRPRTINQALAQRQMPGVQMKQDGGVRHRAVIPSFDVKLTGFGEYDERFYMAICQRWWDLLASQQFASDRVGKVVIVFQLNYDGTISDVKIVENTVGDLLGYVCQKAVTDGAPYERWPSDMRLKLGDQKDIQFIFDYN